MREPLNKPTTPPAEPKGRQVATRVHPDERKRIEAQNQITKIFHGAPDEQAPISYYSPILIQCTLPHSDPKVRDWKKTNGDFTLIVSSGVDDKLTPYGIPYGSFPRLMLAHVITRVIQTGVRQIELGSNFSNFLKEVGYVGNLRGNIRPAKTVRDQMMRLIKASMAVESHSGNDTTGGIDGGQTHLVSKFSLWWDFRQPEQHSLFDSWLELSEPFFNEILRAPVPLSTDVLKALKKSPLALDVYMWASYRLFVMQQMGHDELTLSYGRLQTQFGTGISDDNYRKFRQELKLAFHKVASYWHAPGSELSQLNYEFQEKGLILYRSPLLIGKAKPKARQVEAERILANRSFDIETRKKARMLAGQWSVDFLQTQYFEWITKEGITPKDPCAHFFNFIKTHRQRNGDKP